jgi:hypothetical protein
MSKLKPAVGLALSLLLAVPPGAVASSHREAPITSLDHTADITDFYSFVSYDKPNYVTFIMCVDPFLQPSNGPNYFPFDPGIVYQIKIDNNQDVLADVVFQFRFHTNILNAGLPVGFAGAGNGVDAPTNSPSPVPPGTPIVPPAITSLTGAGAAGLNLQQTFTVDMIKHRTVFPLTNSTGDPLIAVPSNVGPRTMPNYDSLAGQGIYSLDGPDQSQIKVFAGTIADPFFIDLGATFDSLNYRAGTGVEALTPSQDANDQLSSAPNSVAGFNVNAIVIEVPITMLTSDGKLHPATDPRAVIGSWATTSRTQITIRDGGNNPKGPASFGSLVQVQRLGNPLINELVIGTGSKDYWSLSDPMNDGQFAKFDLDPLIARVFNAIYGFKIPAPPRTDLLPLVTYAPPIAPASSKPGPIADLLRLNTGIPATPKGQRKRLGLIAGDPAGFPNGRRPTDDVVDIVERVAIGGVLVKGFNVAPNNLLGDGVNTTDVPPQEAFPYVHFAYSGRDSRHISPGDSTGCGDQPTTTSSQNSDAPPLNQGGPSPCPVN